MFLKTFILSRLGDVTSLAKCGIAEIGIKWPLIKLVMERNYNYIITVSLSFSLMLEHVM